MENLIRKDLHGFKGYSSARKEAQETKINLNANESPWSNGLNRYPDQQPQALVKQLAGYFSVAEDSLLVTRGSDEGIDCLMRLFCQAGQDSIVICPPTFGMYRIAAQLQGAEVIEAPLQVDDYELDRETVLAACKENSKLIFLCSPNNPTGNTVALVDIQYLCEKRQGQSMIIVDEAYIDFADIDSAISLLQQYDNLVILRTFSKAFGLAAARVGVLLGQRSLIDWLKTILAPYPIPAASAKAVLERLQTAPLQTVNECIQATIAERESLIKELNKLEIAQKVWPSQANFVLVQFSLPVFDRCQQQGILLRDMSQRLGLDNVVRISVGTPEENKALLTLLRGMA